MSHLPIPLAVLYAGLAGTVLALVVATATNNWSLRVFFLLALRLAIGWHFLFEGLHKIHSHTVGPTDTNRPFSSEPYFKQSPTWFGAQVRKRLDDPQAVIAAKLTPTRSITPQEFAALSVEEQAAACPPAVAAELDALTDRAAEAIRESGEEALKTAPGDHEKDLKTIADAEAKGKDAAAKKKADDARATAAKKLDAAKADAQKRIDNGKQLAAEAVTA